MGFSLGLLRRFFQGDGGALPVEREKQRCF